MKVKIKKAELNSLEFTKASANIIRYKATRVKQHLLKIKIP